MANRQTSTLDPTSAKAPVPLITPHLKLVARIALFVGLAAAACFFVVAFFMMARDGKTYQDIFFANFQSRQQLAPALLFAGMILAAWAGIVTWVVALYSTFRVAGPVHHFATGLRELIRNGPQPISKMRAEDWLQEEHYHFSAAAKRLQYHYDMMSELVDLARVQVEIPEPNLGHGLTKTIQQLKELESLAKF
ncbi:MAG: hypothetical protein H7833_13780 [Magnetococcus sp. DMHC-1]|nr:hypothetical protein [Magnetococcales bacterium]